MTIHIPTLVLVLLLVLLLVPGPILAGWVGWRLGRQGRNAPEKTESLSIELAGIPHPHRTDDGGVVFMRVNDGPLRWVDEDLQVHDESSPPAPMPPSDLPALVRRIRENMDDILPRYINSLLADSVEDSE